MFDMGVCGSGLIFGVTVIVVATGAVAATPRELHWIPLVFGIVVILATICAALLFGERVFKGIFSSCVQVYQPIRFGFGVGLVIGWMGIINFRHGTGK